MKRFIIFFVFLFVLTIAGAAVAAQEGATKLADGVYGIKGIGEAINTAFVVGDRGVFVYSCDLADYDRRSKIIRETAGGKPIRFVANGHYAFDDVGCNHMFAEQGAIVLGNPVFAKELKPYWPERRTAELKQGKIKKEYLEGKNPDMAMPVVLYNEKLTLDLGGHTIELIYMGKAHTPDNAIVWLPKEKILFVDDLLFVELHPTADDRSDIRAWQSMLRTLATWSPTTVVPGHGIFSPGNGAKPLLDLDRYYETMRAKVKAMKEAGKTLDEIKKGIRAELGEFAKWPRERAIPETAAQIYRELGYK
jgi:glyoxylase-like metal-dependent hydrolase (beta-lactamase superfamily II)